MEESYSSGGGSDEGIGIGIIGSSSTAYDDDDVWTPLRPSDYVHLGLCWSLRRGYLVLVVSLISARQLLSLLAPLPSTSVRIFLKSGLPVLLNHQVSDN